MVRVWVWVGVGIIILGGSSIFDHQKQPFRGVLMKRSSENMQQIYRRTPMSKCDFNKVLLNFKGALLKLHFGMGVLL